MRFDIPIGIISFKKYNFVNVRILQLPNYILERWSVGCIIPFISDGNYDDKKMEINNKPLDFK